MLNTWKSAVGAFLAIAFAIAAVPAGAQTETRTAAHKDWSVFESGSGGSKVCWIVTQPTEWKARRGGKEVQVNRGPIYLMVAIRPGDGVKNEVSFLSGYPFKRGSKVRTSIGGGNWEMFTEAENAWLSSKEQDDAMVAAMRKGASATVVGVSSRGTETIDTFSLSGFTAALEQAQGLCK